MVTILPRGKSLGVTLLLPIEEKDQVSMTKKEMIANITTLLGGRAAEEVIYGKEQVSSGASDDIMKASHMARNMITNLGFSDKLGLVSLAYTTDVTISEYLKKTVDEEVKSIIDCCYEHAKELLTTNKTHLENMAHALMERETLTSSEIEEIMISRE
jgi:cell division protease FtsH